MVCVKSRLRIFAIISEYFLAKEIFRYKALTVRCQKIMISQSQVYFNVKMNYLLIIRMFTHTYTREQFYYASAIEFRLSICGNQQCLHEITIPFINKYFRRLLDTNYLDYQWGKPNRTSLYKFLDYQALQTRANIF